MAEGIHGHTFVHRNLLHIVSSGNALVAEILRLKDYIPDVFRLHTKQDLDVYEQIIVDFRYFKIAEEFEDSLRSSDRRLQDDELKEEYMDILTRFYSAFQSVHKYAIDLNAFVESLPDYTYNNMDMDSIFQDQEGRQLLCEALYLYGTMLLVLDLFIPGVIRERMLVAFYRYSSKLQHRDSNFDEVCNLMMETGFSNHSSAKRPGKYPEMFFQRIEMQPKYLESVIATLRSMDVYNQLPVYPLPEHRTTAFATQAGMLVVCLLFVPQVLQNSYSQMREIVDRFFADNWIVPLFMGITVDLVDLWEPYKAAREALCNIIDPGTVQENCQRYLRNFTKHIKIAQDLLVDGFVTESFVIVNVSKILSILRECNVTLRWFMLLLCAETTLVVSGGHKKCKQLRDLVAETVSISKFEVFQLLLATSQVEIKVKEALEVILAEKETRWETFKRECEQRCQSIQSAFQGEIIIMGIEKNDELAKWFGEFTKEVSDLNTTNDRESSRKLLLLIQALEKIQEFHSIESNVQVCLHLAELRANLRKMIDIMQVKEEMLIKMQVIGDLSYAWLLMDQFKGTIQDQIIKSPRMLINLRTIFVKLSSALEIPLMRINEGKSEDLASVSHYYSHELVNFVKRVIQIIPQKIFGILQEIVQIRTNELKPLPNRVEKSDFSEFAQHETRSRVAHLTYQLSVFTEGVLLMQKTLVGVIEVDPKLLLEDGIREEFKRALEQTLSERLMFNAKAKTAPLHQQLETLGKAIREYRHAFQYVQEYLNIYALKFFHEELLNSVQTSVELECENLRRANAPRFSGQTFLGRLAQELLRLTEPKNHIYVDLMRTWFDRKSLKESLNPEMFTLIRSSLTPTTLKALDVLFAAKLSSEVQQLNAVLEKKIMGDKQWLPLLEEMDQMKESFYKDPHKFNSNFVVKTSKILPEIEDYVHRIGHLQLLRCNLAYHLRMGGSDVQECLENFNKALMISARDAKELPKRSVQGIVTDLQTTGLINPLNTVCGDSPHSPYFSHFWVIFCISVIGRLSLLGNFTAKTPMKKLVQNRDGWVVVHGLLTVFRQYHNVLTQTFLAYFSAYIKCSVESMGGSGAKPEMTQELAVAVRFLELFQWFSGAGKGVNESPIPDVISCNYENWMMQSHSS